MSPALSGSNAAMAPRPVVPPAGEDDRLVAALKPRPLDALRDLQDAVLDIVEAIREVCGAAVRFVRRLIAGRRGPWG